MVQLCSKLALDAFVAGHRADIVIRKTALTIACYEGRQEVTEEDVNEAADFVLFHRVRIPPPPPQHEHEEKERSQEESPEDEKDKEKPEEKPETQNRQKNEVREQEKEGKEKDREESEKSMSGIPILESVFPVGDTFKVRRIQTERDRILRKGSGRRSQARTSSKAGRYIMSTLKTAIFGKR
jgi:magnesium chelatase subunit D